MVGFRVWMLVWILVLFVLVQIADGCSKKHRSPNRHGHHHRHQHRHHKHPKVRRATIKKMFTEEYASKINVTEILTTVAPWRPNGTSSSTLSQSYSDAERIPSLSNFSAVKRTSNIHSANGTYIPNHIATMKTLNYSSNIVENINSSMMNSTNNFEYSQTIAAGLIDKETEQDTRTVVNSSTPLREIPKSVTDITSNFLNSSSKVENRQFANDLQRLFGSPENETNLTNIFYETPVVQLIRRKRSTSSEDEAKNEKSRAPTLLDFDGPAVANDPDEAFDGESSKSLHIRVKRDGSESDEAPSVLSSQDSNYLQDLEESFALSALEVEALKSEDSENYQRKFRRSQPDFDSGNLSRSKRSVEDDNNAVYTTNDPSKETKQSALADTVSENDNVSSKVMVEHFRDSSSFNPFTSRQIIEVSDSTDSSTKRPKFFAKNIPDLEYPENTSSSLDSSTNFVITTQRTVDNKTDSKDFDLDTQSANVNNSIGKDDEPITGYRVEDSENEADANFDSSGSGRTMKPESEATNRESEVVSSPGEASLKDDTSFSRYRLDDVYPEVVEEPAHQSPLVQLVRTKRFSDGFVDLEAPDSSYANEADNGIADEPYAEDNRIIDSMLSKTDYRSGDEQKRLPMIDNEAEIYSPKDDTTSIRYKRAVLSKRSRKKTNGRRRGSKKRKKIHKGRAKKHHRSKIKRESEDLGDRMNFEAEKRLEFDDESFGDRSMMDQEVISPHDGRPRREFEGEENDHFYYRSNVAADSDRRDRRHSADTGNRIETDKLYEGTKIREKRDNALEELKYFQNVREINGVENRSEEIADKHSLSEKVAGPIEDIEHLAEQLLAKVNELHGYINEGGVNGATQDPRASSSIVDRTTGDGSRVVQRVTSRDDSSPKSAAANVGKRPEACWKYPATWNRQSESSKTNDKSVRSSRAQRCSNKNRRKRTSHRKWDRWTDWSSCSVTCGRGRQIRWRHCIRNCSTAETEMEEKACQLPACAPGKFLGIFG